MLIIGNRYELGDKIGIGGMGEVYQAFDRLSDETVALKRVLTSPSNLQFTSRKDDGNLRIALAREFQTLGTLRHPYIITVLDYGFDAEGQPYFTMPIIENAQSIREAARHLAAHESIRLLIKVLHALDYLHRQGIVHRDLKPGNVLVTEDGEVRVVDFGLAVEADYVRQVEGTLAYLAPEVIRSETARIASDLYAVGLIGYEMLTGVYPYRSDNMQELLEDILYKMPDLTIVPGIHSGPPIYADELSSEDNGLAFLDDTPTRDLVLPAGSDTPETPTPAPASITPPGAILGRLLAKNPNDRYPDASTAIQELNSLLAEPVVDDTTVIRDSFIHAARFVGRDVEMQVLGRMLDSAAASRGTAWLIGGESGVGKTRLMREFQIQAIVSGFQVVYGQTMQSHAIPYYMWRTAISQLVLSVPLTDLQAGVLKEIVPSIDRILKREIPPLEPLESKEAGRLRLAETVASVLAAQQRPVLLLLDDLQWAGGSLFILQHLNRIVGQLPVFILGSFRSDEAPELPAQVPEMQVIKLNRLSRQDVRELSIAMLGKEGDHEYVVDFLHTESGGNAFFLVEIVRALAESAGQLDAVGEMVFPDHMITRSVRGIIQKRIQRMPPESQELLHRAAVAGRELNWDILRLTRPNADWDQCFMLASRLAILENREGNVQFINERIRETVLNGLDIETRRIYHRDLAMILESEAVHRPELASLLAYHWREIGDTGREYAALKRAAEYYAQLHLPEPPREHVERALLLLGEHHDPGADDIILRLQLGDDADSDETADIMTRLENARQQAVKTRNYKLLAEVLLRIGMRHWLRGTYALAIPFYREGLTVARREEYWRLTAMLLNRLAIVYFETGQRNKARTHVEESLSIAREMRNKVLESSALNTLATQLFIKGDLNAAERYFERSLKLSRRIGDIQGTANAVNNLGVLCRNRGYHGMALRHLEEALMLYRKIGNRPGEINAMNNLGHIYYQQHKPERARWVLYKALITACDVGIQTSIVETLVGLAALLKNDRSRQLAWLGLVRASSVTGQEVRQMCEFLIQKIGRAMPEAELEAALSAGESLDLMSLAYELIDAYYAEQSGEGIDIDGEPDIDDDRTIM